MSQLGSWVMTLAGPAAKQVLKALGFAMVSYVGFDVAITGLLSQAQAVWGQQGSEVSSIIAMTGINTALAIICGAIVGRVAFVQLKRLIPH